MATDSYYSTQQRTGAQLPSTVYDDPGYGEDAGLDAFTGKLDRVPPVDPSSLNRHDVTLVLVAHNGARWLPRTLEALAMLDRRPERIVAVDTGSRDDTGHILTNALGGHGVTSASRASGFGDAVQAGVTVADELVMSNTAGSFAGAPTDPAAQWIWLLHDDSAPAPDALRRLLETAERRHDAGVIGPKVVSWSEERQLLELGITVTGSGRRHTGLDSREYDQGQHDSPQDVLAVGSAGMLVRRDVWDRLGGFDPVLNIFRDDLDFGWRANQAGFAVVGTPDAVIHHAEAAAHGRRRGGAARNRPHLADRRHAVYVMLANVSLLALPFVAVRMMLGGLARAIGFLLGKQPALTVEELIAVFSVFLRPDRIVTARIKRARTRQKSNRDLRHLFPPAGQQMRRGVENVLGIMSGSTGHDVSGSARRATGGDDDDELPGDDDARILRLIFRPSVVLTTALTVIGLVAVRGLVGAGRLTGGALLPAPDTVAAMWDAYTESWHGVGLGSPTESPPYLAVVAALATVVRNASLALDLLLLGSVPLAGVTSYLLLRKITTAPWLRVWGAATYAMLPATTGAIAAGRIGTSTAAVMTPLVAMAVIRTMGRPGAPGPFRASWSAGLLLAVTAAFVPLIWPIALLLGIVAVATAYRSWAGAVRVAATLVVTPVVLLPWTTSVLSEPRLLFKEAGSPGPGLSETDLAPWAVLLQHPGGPGAAPVWLGAGLLLAAWAALFRHDRRLPVGIAWAVGLAALVAGVVTSWVSVTGSTLETPVSAWPGYATVLVGGAFVAAAVAGADGARSRLRNASFGWRQPLATIVVAAAIATPVAGAGWWVLRGADDPIDRRDARVMPTYVADEAELPERIRTLVLRSADDGRVTYALLRSSGPLLGDAEIGPSPADNMALSEAVADVVSARGGTDSARLAEFGAKYVYVPRPVDADLADTLDSIPGLSRASAPDGAAMWTVEGLAARVWVAKSDRDDGERADDVVATIASDTVDARGEVPDGNAGRLLVVAELADPGWSATLDGEPLSAASYDGWAQAFELPKQGGVVEVTHLGEQRRNWLWFQLAVVIVALVLAAPGMRRQHAAIDAAADIDLDDTDPGSGAVVPAYSTHPIGGREWGGGRERPQAPVQPAPVAKAAEPAAVPVAGPTPDTPEAPATSARERRQGGHRRKKGGSKSLRQSVSRSSGATSRSTGGKRAAGKRAKGRRQSGGE